MNNQRVKFEAWMRENKPTFSLSISSSKPNQYNYVSTNYLWIGWQASQEQYKDQLSSNPLQLDDHIGDCNEVVRSTLESPTNNHIPDGGNMVEQEPLLTLILGGIEGDEYAENDVEWHTKVVEAMQEKLVHGSDSVFVPLYMRSQAQKEPESQWIPIEAAPKNKKIIVRYKNALGKDRTVFAKYIEKFTEESTYDTECETDYCEKDDTFYLKEGWVELIDNWDEFSSVYFDSSNAPTHWMNIPPAPEEE